MSASPFIKRTKPRANARQRDESISGPSSAGDANNVEDEDDGMSISPMLMAKNRKKEKEKKKTGSIGKSRLSFGGDDEDGMEEKTFVPRKSKLSQSISLQKAATTAAAASTIALNSGDYHNPFASKPASTPSTSSSVYNNAYLQELKASTPTRSARPRADEEGVINMEVDEAMNPFQPSASGSGMGQYQVLDTTQGIPDEALIAAAKAKRKTAVGTGVSSGSGLGGEDYISITQDNGKLALFDSDIKSGPHPESRLQREEDEEGDGDEDFADFTEANTKMALGKNANKAAARRLKNDMVDAIDDREIEDQDNEDELAWEMAQAARATGNRDIMATKATEVKKRPYQSAPIPTPRPLPTVSSAAARLQASIAFLESAQTARTGEIDYAERELEACDTQEADLREEVNRVEAKKEWMDEFRGWVEMLGGFLEEKMPVLQKIEQDMMLHYKERHEIYTKRRLADDSDDLALCVGVAGVENEVEEVDEMGRTRRGIDDSGPYSNIRRARRQDRIARRERRASKLRKEQQEAGLSTDSELGEGDTQDYQTAQEALQVRVDNLSSDVKAEDFRDPQLGLAVRFGGWRRQYEEEYNNAYGGLAMVQGWEYWARQEMIGWEPGRTHKSLDSFHWFDCLHRYSRPKADVAQPSDEDDMDVDEELPLGVDGDLAAAMVSSAVTNIITKSVEHGVYDVYSTRQTRNLADLVDVVGEYLGKDGAKYRGILKAILNAFVLTLESSSDLILSVLSPSSVPPPAFDPASRTALATLTNRRLKLLKNLLLWRRYAAIEIAELANRLISDFMSTVLRSSWESGGKECALKLSQAVPTGVLNPELVKSLQGSDGIRH